MNILHFLILFWRFNFGACNVCKVLMRRPHNILIDIKMKGTLKDQVVEIM
jgi:hypothetical protein